MYTYGLTEGELDYIEGRGEVKLNEEVAQTEEELFFEELHSCNSDRGGMYGKEED